MYVIVGMCSLYGIYLSNMTTIGQQLDVKCMNIDAATCTTCACARKFTLI